MGERPDAGRRWKGLLLAACGTPLLVWACDGVQTVRWVGSTDPEVAFAVRDAATGEPVAGARVEVWSEGGLYDERGRRGFALDAGPDGVAREECRGGLCFGTRSRLRFTDTFVVYLPCWRFRTVAGGYEPGERAGLDVPEYVRQARRAGPSKAELVVPVPLLKRRT